MAALTLQNNKHLEELIERHSDEIKKLEALKDEEMKVNVMFDLILFFNVPVISKTAHPPGPRANTGAFDFCEKFWSNSQLCCLFRRSNAPPVRASKIFKSTYSWLLFGLTIGQNRKAAVVLRQTFTCEKKLIQRIIYVN